MQMILTIVSALHVLPAVFWAGTTFALTRTAGAGAERLVFPQAGAAAVTVIAGATLWGLTHRGVFGVQEQVLAFGAAGAVMAAGLQGLSLPAVRRLATASEPGAAEIRRRIALIQRTAAGLLAIAVVCMTVSRYV
jgi:hypothetical protein